MRVGKCPESCPSLAPERFWRVVAELTEEMKLAVVQGIARCRSYSEVVVHLAEEYDVQTVVQHIRHYDPGHPQFNAGEKWRLIFDETRKAYLEEVSTVPAANQGFRLQALQEGIEDARKHKKWALMAMLIEQASKEVGGVFTNARDLRISDSRRPADMTAEERKETLLGMLDEIKAGRPVDQGTATKQ